MGMTFAAMMIPVIPFIGTKTVYAILPFSLGTMVLLIISIISNYQAGNLYEIVKIWPNLIEVKRYETNGKRSEWKANPHWTKVTLYAESQKIENYLTLSGNGREIEVGAFLAPSERLEIKEKIDSIMKRLN